MKTLLSLSLVVFSLLAADLVQADLFEEMDADGDKKVTREEVLSWQARQQPSPVASIEAPTPATPSAAEKNSTSLIKRIEEDFEIRKSFLTVGDSVEPAKLSWTRPKDEQSFYNLDLAVLWGPLFLRNDDDPMGGGRIGDHLLAYRVEPSFEAHVSNGSESSQNSLSYRVPVTFTLIPGGYKIIQDASNPSAVPPKYFFTLHNLIISPVYETDSHNNLKDVEGEIFYTPTIPDIGIGVRWDLIPHVLGVRWRPFLGTELGSTVDRDETTMLKSEKHYSRFTAKLLGELWLGHRLALTEDYVHRNELNGRQRSFNYSELSLMALLDESIKDDPLANHFSVGVTWKRGKDAPTFEDVDSFNAWLGVRF